jgi:hypothetical protein
MQTEKPLYMLFHLLSQFVLKYNFENVAFSQKKLKIITHIINVVKIVNFFFFIKFSSLAVMYKRASQNDVFFLEFFGIQHQHKWGKCENTLTFQAGEKYKIKVYIMRWKSILYFFDYLCVIFFCFSSFHQDCV